MDMSYFGYCHKDVTMTSPKNGPTSSAGARRARPRPPITQREMDIAASIQAVTEEIMLRIARHVARS